MLESTGDDDTQLRSKRRVTPCFDFTSGYGVFLLRVERGGLLPSCLYETA